MYVPRYARTSEACNGSIVNATPVTGRVKKIISTCNNRWVEINVPQTTSSCGNESCTRPNSTNQGYSNCQMCATHRAGKNCPVFLMHERDDASGTLERQVKSTRLQCFEVGVLWVCRDGRVISVRIDERSL